MIWQSVPIMTIVDLTIIIVAGAMLASFAGHRDRIVGARTALAGAAAAIGVLLILSLFLLDVLALWVAPAVIGPTSAASFRATLHTHASGPILLVGLAFLMAGYAVVHRRILSTVGHLERSRTSLRAEVRDILDANRRLEHRVDEQSVELRHSEERFKRLVDNLPGDSFAFSVSPDLRFTDISPSVETIAGYRPDEITESVLSYFTDHPVNARVPDAILDALDGRWGPPIECEIAGRDGEPRRLEVVTFPVTTSSGTVIGLDGIARDVTARVEAEASLRRSHDELESRVRERTLDLLEANAALHESEARLRRLAGRLHAVREEERRRLAREIHDALGQTLTGLKLDLAWLTDRVPSGGGADERVRAATALVEESLSTVRRLSTELRPPILDDLGLEAAVEWYVESFASRTGLEVALDLPAADLGFDDERDTAVFRVLQEALTNVARHAEARRLEVRLAVEEDDLLLRVCDDGVGIQPDQVGAPDSLGLVGMQERAAGLGGRLDVRNGHVGACVDLRLPVSNLKPAGVS